jgi:hypothetical protein
MRKGPLTTAAILTAFIRPPQHPERFANGEFGSAQTEMPLRAQSASGGDLVVSSFLGEKGMCMHGKAFTQYANAEKELCEMAGAVLTNIINEIESRHGIRLAELRVTMDRSHSLNGWPAANCVMVREEEVDVTHEAKADRDDRPLVAMLERRA